MSYLYLVFVLVALLVIWTKGFKVGGGAQRWGLCCKEMKEEMAARHF